MTTEVLTVLARMEDQAAADQAELIELLPVWWTPGLGCFTELEGSDGTAVIQPGVQAGGDPAGQGARGFGGAG